MGPIAGWAAAILGILLLRFAWEHSRPGLAVTGGLILALGLAGWVAAGHGADKAAALMLLVPSLAVLPVLLAGATWRRPKRRVRVPRPIPAPKPDRAEMRRIWVRGTIRTLCAGPLGGLAAAGCGTLVALRAPWDEPNRLVTGAMLFPVIWAAIGVWSTTGRRPLPIAGGLVAIAGLSFLAAAL